MTMKEVIDQMFDLAVDGGFNHEKMSSRKRGNRKHG